MRSDQAPSSRVDLRVQGEPDPSTDDVERRRSIIKSLMKHILEFPNKNHLMTALFQKDDDREYQEISQDANDTVEEQGAILKLIISHEHRRRKM